MITGLSRRAGRDRIAGERAGFTVAAVLATCLALCLVAPGANAGQILWSKSGQIWAMNDNGSAPHALVTSAQLPAASGLDHPDVSPNGGTTVAFDAQTLDSGGGCGVGCGAIYTLASGAVTRLTTPVQYCGNNCPNFSEEYIPTITGQTPAQVLFVNNFDYQGTAGCTNFNCYVFNNSAWEIESRPLGGGTPTEWTTPTGASTEPYTYKTSGTETNVAADPTLVAGQQLAVYTGAFASPAAQTTYCGSSSGQCDPLIVDDETNDSPYVLTYDDAPQVAAAWSPDGSRVADVEGGGQCGIWAYTATPEYDPANPTVGGSATANPAWRAYWVLQDANDVTCGATNPFTAVTWLGDNGLIVADGGNLYSIPASCLATPVNFQSPAPNCNMSSPGVTALTSDGHNDAPTWTSATTPLAVAGTPSPSPAPTPTPTPSPNPTPTPASAHPAITKLTSSGDSLTVTISCTGAASAHCADSIDIQVVEMLRGRTVIAVAARRPKTHRTTVVLASARVTVAGGQTHHVTLTLSKAGRSLLAGRHTLKVAVILSQASKTVATRTVTLHASPARRRTGARASRRRRVRRRRSPPGDGPDGPSWEHAAAAEQASLR